MGRGVDNDSEHPKTRRDGRDIHEIAQDVVEDVVKVFAADCVSSFPRGASIRVFDRKGGRRILRDDADVTHLAQRILYFALSSTQQREAWSGDPQALVRLIAIALYGDENALSYAPSRQPAGEGDAETQP